MDKIHLVIFDNIKSEKMSRKRRKFTVEKKLEIINYFKQNGIARTTREYTISSTMVDKWKDQFDEQGEVGLGSSRNHKSDLAIENDRLRRELKEYKQMLAEKELALRIKESLLKKSVPRLKRRK